jgi:hypothetical protein
VTTDQRVVAKQEIQEVESAKRAGAPYAHHRNQAPIKKLFGAWKLEEVRSFHAPVQNITSCN